MNPGTPLVRLLRFGTVGLFNTGVDVGLFAILHVVLNVPPLLSNCVSYSAGIISSFFLNASWTFADRSQPDGKSSRFARFVMVSLSGLGISTLILAAAMHFMAPMLAKIVSVGVTFFWNFLLADRLVFPRSRGGTAAH